VNILAKDLRRNMLVAGQFIESPVQKYGRYQVYSDDGTWYQEVCVALGLEHFLHSSYEKLLIRNRKS